MLTQPLEHRYTNLRRKGQRAATALQNARAMEKPFYYSEPSINPAFEPKSYDAYGYTGRCRWVENVCALGWREAGFADDILTRLRHRGWFADAYCDNVYRGIVYRLPHGRFLYGYADPHNPGCALLADETAADIEDAARYADSLAERFAERDREYSEAWSTVREAFDSARDARGDTREALLDLRALESCDSPRIKQTIQAAFNAAWRSYRAACTDLKAALADAKPYGISPGDF